MNCIESLAHSTSFLRLDELGDRPCVKLAAGYATLRGQPVRLFEQPVGDGDGGFHGAEYDDGYTRLSVH